MGGKKVNRYKQAGPLRGIMMSNQGIDKQAATWGTMALTTTSSGKVSYRTGWTDKGWNHHRWHFWQDLLTDGALDNPLPSERALPIASLTVQTTLKPKASKEIEFLLTWHFPNRTGWNTQTDDKNVPEVRVGNYYTEQYKNAWDVAAKTHKTLSRLEAGTVDFVRAFCDSDLPQAVKEAALYNLSTLRTQTCSARRTAASTAGKAAATATAAATAPARTSGTTNRPRPSCSATWRGPCARSSSARHRRDNGHMCFRVDLPIEASTDRAWPPPTGRWAA